jgi:periplasmic divalent cation tolerance protein
MKLNVCYTTLSNQNDARDLATKLLTEGLAVCVNIFANVESHYIDQGQLKSSTEFSLLIKFPKSKKKKFLKQIKELHPYETPCLLCFEDTSFNKEYLAWAKQEIGSLEPSA